LNLIICLNKSSLALRGDSAEEIAETTASPSAPASIIAWALSRLTPPIATSLCLDTLCISLIPSIPRGLAISLLVLVEKTGLIPR